MALYDMSDSALKKFSRYWLLAGFYIGYSASRVRLETAVVHKQSGFSINCLKIFDLHQFWCGHCFLDMSASKTTQSQLLVLHHTNSALKLMHVFTRQFPLI
jgi:hypothetical protein